jgi:transposase
LWQMSRERQKRPSIVREVIHAFNEQGLAALDPKWAGGRPRLITDDDVEFIATTALTRPAKLGRPFTRWSIRKLAAYLADNSIRTVDIGRERLRQILHTRRISFQRTRTWKESTDPDKEAELDRIEYVTSHFPDRCLVASTDVVYEFLLVEGVALSPHPRTARRCMACERSIPSQSAPPEAK